MIHDQARVDAIRTRAQAQIELIKLLEAKIVRGKLRMLEVARKQTSHIEAFFLKDLERNQRTPAEEAKLLSFAEHMLQTWAPYLKETEAKFSKFGGHGIEIVGAR
jgi:hypothetical protein